MSTPGAAARLRRRGFWLEYASMAWMTVGAVVAVAAGIVASSVALAGFGLDSVIEFCAAAIAVWQLRGGGEERETRAVKLIGDLLRPGCLSGRRASVTWPCRPGPGESVPGLAVTAAALVVMPLLALARHRTGRALGNRALITDGSRVRPAGGAIISC